MWAWWVSYGSLRDSRCWITTFSVFAVSLVLFRFAEGLFAYLLNYPCSRCFSDRRGVRYKPLSRSGWFCNTRVLYLLCFWVIRQDKMERHAIIVIVPLADLTLTSTREIASSHSSQTYLQGISCIQAHVRYL